MVAADAVCLATILVMNNLHEHYRLLLDLDDAWQVDSVDLRVAVQRADVWKSGWNTAASRLSILTVGRFGRKRT